MLFRAYLPIAFIVWVLVGLMVTLLIPGNLITETLRDRPVAVLAQPLPSVPNENPTIAVPLASDRVMELERNWGGQYDDYFERLSDRPTLNPDQISQRLADLSRTSGAPTALIYTVSRPDALELILVLPSGSMIRRTVRDATPVQLTRTLREFRRALTLRFNVQSPRSLAPSQRLYQWMIKPLEPALKDAQIEVLLFCAGPGLRTLPFAALHDGQRFLGETYGLALIPAFNLINPHYRPLDNEPILAMGASEFSDLANLPAVPSELEAIAQLPWPTTIAINPAFTLDNLTQNLQAQSFPIVHLATHAQFSPGNVEQSFIHLWGDETLSLRQLPSLPWGEANVTLLVLSACQTAVGDRQAELGFAGVAYQAGVDSTVASLWRVSDLGTFVLMQEFYTQLTDPSVHTKVEALRRTQQALSHGDVYIQDGNLHRSRGVMPLPPSFLQVTEAQSANPQTLDSQTLDPQAMTADFTNPYYWAAFTLVGSPW
ncbi:MAG: CHAT domain-containing protein [Leptolyngbyaceae cyanobacterium]